MMRPSVDPVSSRIERCRPHGLALYARIDDDRDSERIRSLRSLHLRGCRTNHVSVGHPAGMSAPGAIQRANSSRPIRLLLKRKRNSFSRFSRWADWSTSTILFSLRRGRGLLALPPLFLCSAPGYHPLVNFCLLVGRKHLENLARLKTLQALERHVLLALG